MFLILPEYKPLIRKWCGLEDGMKILDVGCGTGYFTRLLAEGKQHVQLTGLDIDEVFIAFARKKAEEKGLSIDFLTGDATALPFEEGTFDLVTSHTFFHSVTDPEKALSEMKRVVKKGGMIATVIPMNFLPSGFEAGKYPEECIWYEEFYRLDAKIHQIYLKIDPISSRVMGLAPVKTPGFFAEQGLTEVSAYPIGKLFSTSNAAISKEDKLCWVDLYQESEEKQLEAFLSLPEMFEYCTEEEAFRYRALLRQKCDFLRTHPDENSIWDWQGGANILLTGKWN